MLLLLAAVSEPDLEEAFCRTLGSSCASAGSLVCGFCVLKTPGLLSAHWQVKSHPWVSAGLLAHRAHPGVWLQDLGIPELVSDSWYWGWFLTSLGMLSGVSSSLCWTASVSAKVHLVPG